MEQLQNVYFGAYYKPLNCKDLFIFIQNKTFKRRFKTLEEIEQAIKEDTTKNIEKYVIFQYIETKVKEIKK